MRQRGGDRAFQTVWAGQWSMRRHVGGHCAHWVSKRCLPAPQARCLSFRQCASTVTVVQRTGGYVACASTTGYATPPGAGPAHVLDYLAHYAHRVAISNDRILGQGAASGAGTGHAARTQTEDASHRNYPGVSERGRIDRSAALPAVPVRTLTRGLDLYTTDQASDRRFVCARRHAWARLTAMTPDAPLPPRTPPTGSFRSRGSGYYVQWLRRPILARARPRYDMIHRTRGALAPCRLIQKDEWRGSEVADAIQESSRAHKILNITN